MVRSSTPVVSVVGDAPVCAVVKVDELGPHEPPVGDAVVGVEVLA